MKYNKKYEQGVKYLKGIANMCMMKHYEIVEDTYEYENGLCLIEYEDESHNEEVDHYCINLDKRKEWL